MSKNCSNSRLIVWDSLLQLDLSDARVLRPRILEEVSFSLLMQDLIFPTQRWNPALRLAGGLLQAEHKEMKIWKWVGSLPFLVDLQPGIKLNSPALQVDFTTKAIRDAPHLRPFKPQSEGWPEEICVNEVKKTVPWNSRRVRKVREPGTLGKKGCHGDWSATGEWEHVYQRCLGTGVQGCRDPGRIALLKAMNRDKGSLKDGWLETKATWFSKWSAKNTQLNFR